jgi:cellulose synthase/poly-beta-1,6-N-acetylglucosamine synthase-like glycosyltransferase
MKDKLHLLILLPLYNPKQDWYYDIQEEISVLESYFRDKSYRIVFIDDGSKVPLNFDIINSEYQKGLTLKSNLGKGGALRNALSIYDTELLIYTDADLPYGSTSLIETYELLTHNKIDYVLSRRQKDYFNQLPFFRKIVSKCLVVVNSLIFGISHLDTQGGLKGYNQKAIKIFTKGKINNFLFEIEMIKSCLKQNLIISSIPVSPRKVLEFTEFKPIQLLKLIFGVMKIYFHFKK